MRLYEEVLTLTMKVKTKNFIKIVLGLIAFIAIVDTVLFQYLTESFSPDVRSRKKVHKQIEKDEFGGERVVFIPDEIMNQGIGGKKNFIQMMDGRTFFQIVTTPKYRKGARRRWKIEIEAENRAKSSSQETENRAKSSQETENQTKHASASKGLRTIIPFSNYLHNISLDRYNIMPLNKMAANPDDPKLIQIIQDQWLWPPFSKKGGYFREPRKVYPKLSIIVDKILEKKVGPFLFDIMITPHTNRKMSQTTNHCLKCIFPPSLEQE